MLVLDDVSLAFGARPVLEDVGWHLGDGERVALVGANGAGKTTLLRVALGLLDPDRGTVTRSQDVVTGYLPQEEVPLDGETAFEVALRSFDVALRAEEQLRELEARAGSLAEADPQLPDVLRRIGEFQHQFEHADGFRMRAETERVLAGLGLSQARMHAPVSELSGGWRMRVALARLLLARPTHLFLDEPTNHLDLPSLAWMEEFLREYRGTVVVISHDPVFLDRLVDQVYEIDGGRLTEYRGNYTAYRQERAQRRAALLAAQKNQERRVQQLERFVERFRAKNTKASQARSKQRALERIERIEVQREPERIRFRFSPAPRCGRRVIALEGVHKTYPPATEVFASLDLEVERGEKVALVGPNGAGKSTLLRLLAGQESFQSGHRHQDDRARIEIYAQHTFESLDLDSVVLDELRSAAPHESETRLRGLLGAFLFGEGEVDKRVAVLSGGEKARLALARTLIRPANLLLLDEPTNHLDIAGREVLQEALARWDGTVVLVTHDRNLIDAVADRVVEVETGGRVRSYPGNFTDYAALRGREGRPLPGYGAASAAKKLSRDAAVAELPPRRDGTSSDYLERKEERRALQRDARRREAEERRVTARIEELEELQGRLEARLQDVALHADGDAMRELVGEYDGVRAELTALWERLEELG